MGILIGLLIFAGVGNSIYVPTDSQIYDDLDLLKTSGLIKSLPSTSKPWTEEECRRLFLEAESIARGCQLNLAQKAALERLQWELVKKKPVVQLGGAGRPVQIDWCSRMSVASDRQRLSPGMVIQNRSAERFFFYQRIDVTVFNPAVSRVYDSSGWHNPGFRGVSMRDRVLGEMERTYLGLRLAGFRIELGRDEFFWGPGYLSSVMLSERAPALDQVQLLIRGENLKFLAFTAMLSRWNERHRFLSAQRLEVALFNRLTLGSAMFNVYTYEDAWDFPGMLNPLIPLHLSVANSGHGDNLLVGGDAVFYLGKGKIYGQLLIDNYEFNTRKDAPNCVGLQAGFFLLPAGFEVRAEYALITAFTYYHRVYSIMFENYGVPLGHELGPDADRLWVRVSYPPVTWLKVSIVGDGTRRGYYNRGGFLRQSYVMEDTVFLRYYYRFPAKGWDTTSTDVDVEVERVLRIGPELELSLPRGFYLQAQLKGAFYYNRDGLPGRKMFAPEMGLELRYRY